MALLNLNGSLQSLAHRALGKHKMRNQNRGTCITMSSLWFLEVFPLSLATQHIN